MSSSESAESIIESIPVEKTFFHSRYYIEMKPLRPAWALIAIVVFLFILLTLPRPLRQQGASPLNTHLATQSRALLLTTARPLDAILERYKAKQEPVRVFIVPGHHNNSSGASAYGAREADLVANIGERLAAMLTKDSRLAVTLSRDTKGFREPFASFLTSCANAIALFREDIRRDYAELVLSGKIAHPSYSPPHGTAILADALKLYGANLWAYENNVDIIIHLHLNDYAGRKSPQGKYSGYAVYYAGPPLPNTIASAKLADSITKRLHVVRPTSDFPSEIGGLIPDAELLALGAHGSVDAAAVLIEYGYISERVFSRSETRDAMADLVAYETARGVLDFLSSKTIIPPPASLNASLAQLPSSPSASALGLQYQLLGMGLYPPTGKSLRDCPLTGFAGPCTESAHRAYLQKTARTP